MTTPASSSSTRPVAVVGATGLQGGSTVRALLHAGASVRALTRRGVVAASTGVRAVFAMTTPGSQQSTDDETSVRSPPAPARHEALPLEALGDNADQRAMSWWFASRPAYQADFKATRALQPATLTFAAW